jgi:hypothetical protein
LSVLRSPAEKGIHYPSLVFSFLIYATLVSLALSDVPALSIPRNADELSETAQLTLDPWFVIGALGLAILYPLLLGILLTTDAHMKVLRWLRVSNKTSRETTWLDVFSDQTRYVIVNLSGRRRVFGWPLYYSNDRDEGLLYLYDPAWVNDDGTYTELDIHGLFLVEAGTIESIEFTNVEKLNARPARQG